MQNVAETYGGSITYADLRNRVQGDEHTGQRLSSWSFLVLNRVINLCEARGPPELTSLVVQEATGMVGRGFNGVIERSGQDAAETQLEREMAAAVERLRCYHVYCPNVPEDAEPQHTRKYNIYRADIERKNKPTRPVRPVCSTCGYQKPATGQCDNCV